MDRWDMLIIAGAGYVAIMTLARLMVARRNQLISHVREQMDQAREQTSAASKQANNEDADRGAA